MNQQWIELAYLAAAVMFIFALKAMSSPRTARRGNLIGALGMLVAIVCTLLSRQVVSWGWIVAGLVLGSAIGGYLAVKVKMTGMPQMVAIFNGMGGLASGLVVLVIAFTQSCVPYTALTVGISTFIGWLTLTGSLVAFAKLQGFVLSGRPVLFPMQRLANLGLLVACVGVIVLWTIFPAWWLLVIPLLLMACALGIGFTIPIGGGDMPVVISLLNSCSGLAACATGFVLGNSGLIIAGALVGASGIILTRIMCIAMNRSLGNVLFAGVGVAVVSAEGSGEDRKPVTSWTPEDAAMCLENSSNVVIVPGYGMAVAQAQHALRELSDLLEASGVVVKYGIHEVAGRMPGHMNVLLAEADVPYEQLLDRQSINPEFDHTDAVLVIGANDVVNPSARSDKTSPIYGMPILDVDKAGTVMVCKRTLNPGFAGIDNELFYQPNTAMIFGDAKKTITEIIAALKD